MIRGVKDIAYAENCLICDWFNIRHTKKCFHCGSTNMRTFMTSIGKLKHQYQWKHKWEWLMGEDEIEKELKRWEPEFALEMLL